VATVLERFIREENLERYGLDSVEFRSSKKARTARVIQDVRRLSQQRLSPRLISYLFAELRQVEIELVGQAPLVKRVSAASAKKIVQRLPARTLPQQN
jgi:hypothetical protein